MVPISHNSKFRLISKLQWQRLLLIFMYYMKIGLKSRDKIMKVILKIQLYGQLYGWKEALPISLDSKSQPVLSYHDKDYITS